MTAPRRCHRCSGRMFLARQPEGYEWTCMLCGHVEYTVELAPLLTRGERRKKLPRHGGARI